jgi:hypothetical protein
MMSRPRTRTMIALTLAPERTKATKRVLRGMATVSITTSRAATVLGFFFTSLTGGSVSQLGWNLGSAPIATIDLGRPPPA